MRSGDKPFSQHAESDGIQISQAELDSAFFGNLGGRFPPVLNVSQAAELLQVPVKTLYEWSSRGRLRSCARRRGKRLFFWRDLLIRELFEGKEWEP